MAVCLAVLLVACGGQGSSTTPSPTVVTPTPTPSPKGPLNVILIVADDLGWGDLSSYGSPIIKTPNLDRMATEGMRLTQFTVPSPVCAPSRAALMTGRYPARTGIHWNPPDSLRPRERTLGDLFKAQGYATGMVGKWHLGFEHDDLPVYHGFDFYYGLPYGEDPNGFYLNDGPTNDTVGFELLARKYTEEAVKFIRRSEGRPFFLYVAHRSPHTPLLASDQFLGRSMGGIYGDVVEELDFQVGELLRAIKEMGKDRNTLVVFTSDNGPSRQDGEFGSAGPFLGGKGSCLEGGVRVPAIVWWPGRISGGRVSDEPTSTLDLLPTFFAAAALSEPTDRPLDGRDLMPLLTGAVSQLSGPGEGGGRELLHFYSSEAVALRSGRFKYLAPGFWDTAPGLYDLSSDPGEARNLIPEQPEQARRLKDRLALLADIVSKEQPVPR